MAKKKQVAVDNAVQSIISGSQNKTRKSSSSKDSKILSARVKIDGVADKFEAAANDLGVTQAALLSYLIKKFLKEWDAGERPQKKTKTIEVLTLE